MEASGARVEASGSFIRVDELVTFGEELKSLDAALGGTAALRCLEPVLGIRLEGDGFGHIEVMVDITPDLMSQSHSFSFGVDQTYLRPLAAACESILERFPVRGSRSD
jgi:hypothetical protein